MSKTHIVSNRLPVEVKLSKNNVNFYNSAGGLATGLKSLPKSQAGTWFGWPGIADQDLNKNGLEKSHEEIADHLKKEGCAPIFLSRKELNGYYYGFSNQTLNPLFHYFPQYVVYNQQFWTEYQQVNQKFADQILKNIKPHDTVWIHDYHLFLLPSLLRKEMPDLSIGFFLHIPFPSSELFRTLPWREEILRGVLGADLIGFHTHNYVRHFLQSLNSILGIEHDLGRLNFRKRIIKIDTFPMGIDYNHFHDLAVSLKSQHQLDPSPYQTSKIILSVDRLDYAKGILQKLRAFEKLVQENSSLKGKVSLVIIVVPSRTKVSHYQQLKKDIDELVGKINGRFGTLGWLPVQYLSQKFSQKDLINFYQQADVLLITSFRDGMNLVAKEYVASRVDQNGVVVISERAGAAREMPESLLVNPNDTQQITSKLKLALEMPIVEQQERMKAMQKRFAYYDIFWWANSFLKQLQKTKTVQYHKKTRDLSSGIMTRIIHQYHKSQHRLLIFDYDGTLVELKSRPEKAIPDQEVISLLNSIATDPSNHVVILSGRDANFLERYLGQLPLTLIAEHGYLSKEPDGDWINHGSTFLNWQDEIKSILQLYVDLTPGSFIEEKKNSMAWHYRQVDPLLAKKRVKELKDDLRNFTNNDDLGFIDGHKVVEIQSQQISKGTVTKQLLDQGENDFILALGDDATDENIFENLPESAYSIKVGEQMTGARFRVDSQAEVISLLKELV